MPLGEISVNQNPIIASLKARLESERFTNVEKYIKKQLKEMNVSRLDYDQCWIGYEKGHEAATERLLGLLEKAVETITTLGEKHPDCFCMYREAISKEFLSTLADASGEMKNES